MPVPSERNGTKAFHGRWVDLPSLIVTVTARTRDQARTLIHQMAQDAGLAAHLAEIQVRPGCFIRSRDTWQD